MEALESHLKVLEGEIDAAAGNKQNICDELAEIDSILKLMEEKKSLQTDLANDRQIVEKNFEAVTSLEGLQGWTLLCAEESNISVKFIGGIQELSFRLDFTVASSGQVFCETNPVSHPNSKKGVYTPSVKSFFARKVKELRKSLSSSKMKSSSDICSTIHHVEWYLGRLDVIGKELSMLEIRYAGKLRSIDASMDCLLLIKQMKLRSMLVLRLEIRIRLYWTLTSLEILTLVHLKDI